MRVLFALQQHSHGSFTSHWRICVSFLHSDDGVGITVPRDDFAWLLQVVQTLFERYHGFGLVAMHHPDTVTVENNSCVFLCQPRNRQKVIVNVGVYNALDSLISVCLPVSS